MTMIVAVDIDGVLANSLHRAKYVPDDWDMFYGLIYKDPPIPEMVKLVRNLSRLNTIVFITGRSEKARDQTVKWLNERLGLVAYNLLMRPDGDHRPNWMIKCEMCEATRPDLIIDDDDVTARELNDRGFKVLLFLWSKDFARERVRIEALAEVEDVQ